MNLDPANPVVALCAEGMQQEGIPGAAKKCFEEAWAIRRDDVDASIAAHFLARHQATPADTLRWNRLALQHAQAVSDARTESFMASLYLNLGDSLLATGAIDEANRSLAHARHWLATLPASGYRDLVARGIEGLATRIHVALPATTPQP
ncbi:MAG: hypothetical protein ABI910_09195 [Gemmatimonadota bacterium]